MYVPPDFRPHGDAEMFTVIKRHPFVTVATADPLGGPPMATHLPIPLDRDHRPHAYVCASWYAE